MYMCRCSAKQKSGSRVSPGPLEAKRALDKPISQFTKSLELLTYTIASMGITIKDMTVWPMMRGSRKAAAESCSALKVALWLAKGCTSDCHVIAK